MPVVSIATAAPAFAASPCAALTNQTLDWDGANTTYTRNSPASGTAIFDPDGLGPIPTLTLGVAASYVGNMRAGNEAGSTANALRVKAAIGGLGISGLGLEQATTSKSPQGSADRGTYTFTFSQPVTNLRFTLTDIDSASNDFWDVLQPQAGYTVTSQGSGVGTDTNGIGGGRRFFRTVANGPVDNTTGSAGNLGLSYAGPVTTFSITYWNGASAFGDTIDTDQIIYISDMTFDYKPC
ncbi:hypothetical protein [Nocardioides sp.]|uniref:hypothetical protein n=1 Tax=Nocardioides sp. TaxID=35761 RepID=UPI002B8D02C7|nr:hypothetical protein [Nocardioides sp.]HXH77201.1 hypothetical protein [Nocardioides sp.]